MSSGRSSRERRQQSLQRGPDESGCEPDQGREGENEELCIRESSGGRAAECERSNESQRKQKALAPESIAERRCEWGDDRRRQQAHKPGDPDG